MAGALLDLGLAIDSRSQVQINVFGAPFGVPAFSIMFLTFSYFCGGFLFKLIPFL
jgi:hypothetical protein